MSPTSYQAALSRENITTKYDTISFQIDYKTDYQARQYVTLGDNRENDFFSSDVFASFLENETV